MKSIDREGAQGDVYFRKVPAIPNEAKEVERQNGEPIVAGHSETGHNHVIMAPDAVHYVLASNALKSYVKLGAKPVQVEHLRDWDTHETLELRGNPGEVYEIIRQKEWTPEGWERQVLD